MRKIREGFYRGVSNVCDSAMLAISPEAGARRIAIRRRWEAAEKQFAQYEGAEHTDTRAGKWMGSRLSADSGLELDLETLRTRSREVYRNDSVGGAVDDRVNHVVYCGYRPQAKVKTASGSADKPLNSDLERLFKQWAKKAGRNGKASLWSVLRLAERCHAVDGEAFIVLSDLGSVDKPVPLALEVVDCDRVQTPPEQMGNPRVRMGIEYDAQDRIVAYWIRKTHPYDTLKIDFTFERFEASRVCHLFEPWFAGQSRGLPWMTRTLNRIKDAKDYDEANILAAQVEACFAAFITTSINPLTGAAAGANGSTNANGNRLQDIQPGTISYVGAGDSISFGQPQRPGNGFAPFQEWNYRRAAAGMNWPYEMLVKNWSGTSFAGGRLVLTGGRMECRVKQHQLTEQVLDPIWDRFVDECVILDVVDIDPREYSAEPHKYREHAWIPPAWPYALSPGEEVSATITEIQGNLKTHAAALAERGLDYDEVMEERRQERLDEIELGIVPPGPNGALPTQAADPESDPTEEPSDPQTAEEEAADETEQEQPEEAPA